MIHQKVVILMCTYNGQRYLSEQLESICAQNHKDWELWVSDDGSTDDTYQILQNFQNRFNDRVFIYAGPRKGFSANFLSLVCKQNLTGTYYAYSDQDDIWQPNKLQQALDWLNTIPIEKPVLYCARTKIVNEQGDEVGLSPLFKRRPGFLNALIQNIGGGNTMVFNNATLNLLREAGEGINIVAHDWWTYMVVTGAGGEVFYDSRPTLDYRQHGNNLIGVNTGWLARCGRVSLLFKGRFKTWNNSNFKALESIQHRLTDENRQVLIDLGEARKCGLLSRMIRIGRIGIYRQTFLGNIGLTAAAFFNKI